MIHPNIPFWRAVAIMVGSVIGVGVFALPYTFSQSGFLIGASFLVGMTVFLGTMQLMYGEIALQTPGNHDRLVGYVRRYLGRNASRVALIALFGTLVGAMLAYIIVGGEFLHVLLSPLLGGSAFVYSLFFAGLIGTLTWRGFSSLARIELVVMSVLIFLFGFMSLAALPHVEWQNLTYINTSNLFLPYGVILFSMAGLAAVPEMEEVLGNKAKLLLPKAIILSLSIIALVYLVFTFTVVGSLGALTSPTALPGLVTLLGPVFGVVGSFMGTLTLISIALMVNGEMQNTFKYDLAMPKWAAWLIVSGVPPLLYLLGIRELSTLVGFVGALFGGILGIMIVLTYEKMRRSPLCAEHKCLEVPHILSWTVITVFFVGIVWEVISKLF